MTNSVQTWTPPQSKYVRWAVSGILGVAALFVGAKVVTTVVPTVDAAVGLIATLFASLTNMAIAGVIMIAVFWLAYEIISPKGRINRLFGQAYDSLINRLTWELLNVDPLSPLIEKQREAEEKKSLFDEAVSKLAGVIGNWQNKEAAYRKEAQQNERLARAADKKRVDENGQPNPEAETAFHQLSYAAGRCNETADRYRDRRLGLTKMVDQLRRVQGVLAVLISNMELDTRIARDEWQAVKEMSSAEAAAKGVMKNSKEELAKNALDLIQTRYGESFGRIDHLTDLMQPMMASIDLEQGAYSEELLAKWQQESQLLIEGPKAQPIPVAAPVPQQASFTGLIRRNP